MSSLLPANARHVYNCVLDEKEGIYFKIVILHGANYCAFIEYTKRITNTDVMSLVEFSQKELQEFIINLQCLLSERCTRKIQAKLNLEIARNNRGVYILNHSLKKSTTDNGFKIYLSIEALQVLITISNEIQLDHSYVSPYFFDGCPFTGATDGRMLKHLTVMCAQYYYHNVLEKIKKHLCCLHKQTWDSQHERNCSLDSKQSLCYSVAKEAVQLVKENLLSDILRSHFLGPVTISMAQIIGPDPHEVIQKVHFNAYYFFSHSLVLAGMHHVIKFFKNPVYFNKNVVIGCEMCRNPRRD